MLEEWWVEVELKGCGSEDGRECAPTFPALRIILRLIRTPSHWHARRASTPWDNPVECLSSSLTQHPPPPLPSSAGARVERRINRGINLLNFVFPDPVPPSPCFSSLFQSLSFCFHFLESIPDAFRINPLPLTRGLGKPESHSHPPFTPVISPPEVNFQLAPDVVGQLVLAAVGKEEEEPAQKEEDEAVREEEDCPCEKEDCPCEKEDCPCEKEDCPCKKEEDEKEVVLPLCKSRSLRGGVVGNET